MGGGTASRMRKCHGCEMITGTQALAIIWDDVGDKIDAVSHDIEGLISTINAGFNNCIWLENVERVVPLLS